MSPPADGPGFAPRHPLPAELLHELRTPLSHIIGYTEMLLEQARAAGDETYLTELEKVNAAGHRLLALMESSFQGVRPATPPDAPPVDAALTSRS